MSKKNHRLLLSVAGFFLLLAFQLFFSASSEAIDNPHNSISTTQCISCHDDAKSAATSSWWSDQEANVCGQCHNSTGATGADVVTHKKEAGTILVTCTECHDPHNQMQNRAWTTLSYLESGTSSTTAGSITTTTLKKSGAANWTPNQWAGMLLVPNVRYQAFSYRIASNTADTITISTGPLGLDAINLAYARPGNTFAIAWGKLVKENVRGMNVKFFRETGANSFADGDATIDGICQVCHTKTKYFKNDGSVIDAGHPTPAGVKCVTCHNHQEGFKASCSSCHGNPPVAATLGGPTGLAKNSSEQGTGSTTAGAHGKHASTAGKNYACDVCHYSSAGSGSTHNNALIVTLGFKSVNSVLLGGSYDGQTTVTYNTTTNTTTVTSPGTGALKCSNIYCHSTVQSGTDGRGAPTFATPAWNGLGSVVCGSCHKADGSQGLATTMDSGSHTGHLGIPATSCDTCHTASDASTHVDGNITMLPALDYNGSPVPQAGFSTCSTASCHVSAYANTNIESPVWGTAAGCGACHPVTADGAPATGSHGKHMAITPAIPDCSACHAGASKGLSGGASHLNTTIEVANTYSASPVTKHAPGTYTGTCSSAACHDNGRGVSVETPVWGSVNSDCSACHARQPATGSHTKHLSGTLYNRAACGDCHDNAVEATTAPTTHLNNNVDVHDAASGDLGYPQTVAKHNDNIYSNCTQAYCHSSGQSLNGSSATPVYQSVTWGGTAVCGTCHKTKSGDSLGAIDSGSHTEHLAQSGIGCGNCHAGSANDATAYDSTSHVNRAIDVAAGLTYTAQGAPGNGYGTCATATCHGSGMDVGGDMNGGTNLTPTWGDALTGACGTCHGATASNPPLRGSHQTHAGNASFERQIACSVCHYSYASTHADGYANWSFDTTTYPLLSGALYRSASTGSVSPLPNTGQCTNLYCHSIIQTATGGPLTGLLGEYKTPEWGNGATGACGTCHDVETGHVMTLPAVISTGSHSKHLQYSFGTGGETTKCAICHKYNSAGAIDNCNACHFEDIAKHINYKIDISFELAFAGTGTYLGSPVPGSGYFNCANTYCHSNGTSLASYPANTTQNWGTTLATDCTGCHGGDATATLGQGKITTGAHIQHTNDTANRVGWNIPCGECHKATAHPSNNRAIFNIANHVNRSVNIKFHNNSGLGLNRDTDLPTYNGIATWTATGAAVAPTGTGSCSNVYCHSIGNVDVPNGALVSAGSISFRTIAWNGSIGCDGCHGDQAGKAYPIYSSGTAGSTTANSHYKHVEIGNDGCDLCHTRTVTMSSLPPTGVISGGSGTYHINRIEDVYIKTYEGATGTYDAGSKACSSTYCHSGPTVPVWGGTVSCSKDGIGCHAGNNTLAGKHSVHYEISSPSGTFNRAANDSTATAYGFNCAVCHADAVHGGGRANPPDRVAEIKFNSALVGNATYTQGVAQAPDPAGFVFTNGACSATYCHSPGTKTVAPYEDPVTTAFNWGSGSTLTCNGCHGNTTYEDYREAAPLYASGSPKQNAHRPHTDARASAGADATECSDCHNATTTSNTAIDDKTKHVNRLVEVAAGSATYALGADVSTTGAVVTGYSGGSCSASSCHPAGTTTASNSTTTIPWNDSDAANYQCTDCHSVNLTANTSYHHAMNNETYTPGATTGYPTAVPQGNYSSGTNSTSRTCLMCHVKHNISSNRINTNAALTAPRAMNLRTDITAAPTTAANYGNADFVSGAGPNYGICESCHRSALTKDAGRQASDTTTVTSVVPGAAYDASAHQYQVATTMKTGGATFNADCAKCHNAKEGEGATTFQNNAVSGKSFGTHDSTSKRLLASLGGILAEDYEEAFCYRCHSNQADTIGGTKKPAANNDWYGVVTTMTAASQNIYAAMQLGSTGSPEVVTNTDTLYLKNTQLTGLTAAYILASGTYAGTNNFGTQAMPKDLSPNAGAAAASIAQTESTTTNRYYRFGQYITPPLKNGVSYTTTQSFMLYVQGAQSTTNMNPFLRYSLYRWDSASKTVVTATPLKAVTANTTELGNNVANTKYMNTLTFSPTNNVTFNANDRIILEIEGYENTTNGGTITVYFGNATDNSRLVLPGAIDFITTPAVPASGRHDVAAYSGLHKPSLTDETRAYLSANKHVECNDCHNPHEAQAGTNSGTQTNVAGGALRGAPAVNPTNGTGMFSTATAWAEDKIAAAGTYQYEYQICFRCHSSYNQSLTTWSASWTPVDREFNPSNVGNFAGTWASGETAGSFHPVMAAATNNLGRTNNIIAPWTTSSVMMCSDCHASETTTDPNGPHGSAANFILKGPNTTWNESIASLGNNAWMPAGTFCLNCHANNDTNGRFPEHSRSGDHSIACSKCHVMVPHGSEHPGLLHSAAGRGAGVPAPTYVNSAPYMRATTGSRLYIASYPANNTTAWGQSNCGCNGTGH